MTDSKYIRYVREYFFYFLAYSIFGWLYEVFLEVVVYHWGFSNRGVLFGPYCPVYGCGAMLFLLLVYPLIRNKNWKNRLKMIPLVFLLCMVTATILELLTSYLCEFTMGSWPWQTYASYPYNFQARIALNPSIRFGLGGLIFLYILQPILERIAKSNTSGIVHKLLYAGYLLVSAAFAIDIVRFLVLRIAG